MKTGRVHRIVSLVTLVTLCMGHLALGQMSNHIVKESSSASSEAAAESSASSNESAPPPPPTPHGGAHPPPAPGGVLPPPISRGAGVGAGAGFHKHLDFSVGTGAGAGGPYGPLLASLFAGGAPSVPPPPPAAPYPPPPVVGPPPPPFDPILGGPGYMGFPGFQGPSYVPASWIGSAMGAKGDLLFPIVIFVFVVVGVWAVVQFLLALIVPLIAGKLSIDKAIIGKKFARDVDPDPWDYDAKQKQKIDDLTYRLMRSLVDVDADVDVSL